MFRIEAEQHILKMTDKVKEAVEYYLTRVPPGVRNPEVFARAILLKNTGYTMDIRLIMPNRPRPKKEENDGRQEDRRQENG